MNISMDNDGNCIGIVYIYIFFKKSFFYPLFEKQRSAELPTGKGEKSGTPQLRLSSEMSLIGKPLTPKFGQFGNKRIPTGLRSAALAMDLRRLNTPSGWRHRALLRRGG